MLHLKVRQTSATLSGFDDPMREPRAFESPLCAQSGGDFWFPEPGLGSTSEALYARSICDQCVHQSECAEWGINNERYGIWGGLSEFQRKQIRRQRNIVIKEERSA